VSADLPAAAAWRHVGARVGFEVLFLHREPGGYRFDGHVTAVEEGRAWSVRYAISVDRSWAARDAHVVGESAQGTSELRLERDGNGHWRIDGRPAPGLDGCVDVDLEASAFTNAFPVHRLSLAVGRQGEAPAAYVRAPGLEVERLEQSYERLESGGEEARYAYEAPVFDFGAELVYDEFGLVLDYPGIAVRVV
jgi:uncharacterized protein